LLNGVYQFSGKIAAFAGLTVILGAVYMLRSYQGIMLGEKKDAGMSFGPLAGTDKAVLLIICATVIFFGVYPKPLNDIAEQGARMMMQYLH
jgi:NADH-quinone oxidoreductase subunit M